jgi:hypothetical protein
MKRCIRVEPGGIAYADDMLPPAYVKDAKGVEK